MTLAPVQASQAPALFELLLALGESDGVKDIRITLEALQAQLFSDAPAAVPQWVMAGDDVAGFVIHSWKWGPFTGTRDMYLHALYIRPEFRHRGLATQAMAALARIAQANGCTRMEWLALKDKAPTRSFYGAVGAREADHMTVLRLQGDALAKLAAG